MGDAEIKAVNSGFKTLLAYGRAISGLGWFIFVLGAILIVLGIGDILWYSGSFRNPSSIGVLEPFVIMIVGLTLDICGIMLVVSGQLISCFVSIERNTRGIWELLKKKEGTVGN